MGTNIGVMGGYESKKGIFVISKANKIAWETRFNPIPSRVSDLGNKGRIIDLVERNQQNLKTLLIYGLFCTKIYFI